MHLECKTNEKKLFTISCISINNVDWNTFVWWNKTIMMAFNKGKFILCRAYRMGNVLHNILLAWIHLFVIFILMTTQFPKCPRN